MIVKLRSVLKSSTGHPSLHGNQTIEAMHSLTTRIHPSPEPLSTIQKPMFPTTLRFCANRCRRCSRDVIYGMVLQTSKQENLTGIVKSFPSIELIDRIIKDYFYFQQQQVASWIHCPTFQLSSEGPGILAAQASAGAALSPIFDNSEAQICTDGDGTSAFTCWFALSSFNNCLSWLTCQFHPSMRLITALTRSASVPGVCTSD